MARARITLTTDTGGDATDTGPPMTGLVAQIRLDGADLDTGTDILIQAVQSGMVVADYDNVGGSWTRVPRILSFDTGGAAVGDQCPLLDNEQLRFTVNQSAGVTGSKTCTVYVWTVS